MQCDCQDGRVLNRRVDTPGLEGSAMASPHTGIICPMVSFWGMPLLLGLLNIDVPVQPPVYHKIL